jgi:hypothetical protein
VGRASRLKREKRKLLELLSKAQESLPIRKDRTGSWHRIPLVGKIVIGAAVSLFGAWGAYIQTIKPRIQIQAPRRLVDPRNPYSAPFRLLNDGYLTLHHVTIDCAPALIAANANLAASRRDLVTLARYRVRTLNGLLPDDPKPFVCDAFKDLTAINATVTGVEVRVTVTVSPFSFINLAYSKSILFETDSNGTRKFQWHELSVGETPHFPKANWWLQILKNGKLRSTARNSN